MLLNLVWQAHRRLDREEKWIRKWLTRRNHPRTTKSKARANSQTGTSSPDYTAFASNITLTESSPLGNEDLDIQNSATAFSMLNLLTDVSPRSISVAVSRPDISRSLSAPELHVPTRDSDAYGSLLHYGPAYLRLLAMSPSLGYIPSVFPPITTTNSARAAPTTDLTIMQLATESSPRSRSLQSILSDPNFQANVTCDGPDDRTAFDSSTLAQLLQEAATTSQNERGTDTERPTLPSSALQPAILPSVGTSLEDFSFAPSLQSHSTSVMFNQTTRFYMRPSLSYQSSFQPLPISYKTKLSDLMALSKRIRAASPLMSTQLSATDSEESMSIL